MVSLDDRLADRKSHPRAASLCGEERLENTARILRVDSGSCIFHGDKNAQAGLDSRCYSKYTRTFIDRFHSFDRIRNQIHEDLLQLDAVADDRWNTIVQLGHHGYASRPQVDLNKRKSFLNKAVDVQ